MKARSLLILLVIIGTLVAGVGVTNAQEQHFTNWCGGAPQPRLVPGQQGRVTPGLPNVLRSQPGRGWNSQIIGQIPGGQVFTVVYGHAAQCADGMWWYLVNYNGLQGWTAEGDAYGTYWTEPVSYQPGNCDVLAPRLWVGGQGRVTPGLPNVLRAAPYTGAGSAIIGQIPGGGVFTVVGGSECNNGMRWWYVEFNGIRGWTPEGQNGTYWLEPWAPQQPTCVGDFPSRLWVGGRGRVTPGLPNVLRSQPTVYSTRVGTIPAYGVFTVVGGPQCADGIVWWHVNYNGVHGWTGESRWGQFWVEPIYW